MNIRTTSTEHMKCVTAVMEVLRDDSRLEAEPFKSMSDTTFENFISDVAGTVGQYLTHFNVDPSNTALVDYIIRSELDSHVLWLNALKENNTITITIDGTDPITGEVKRTNHIELVDTETDRFMESRLARVMRSYRNNNYDIHIHIER